MIYHSNHQLNLDVAYGCQEASTVDLFLQLLDQLPTPELTELKAYNNTWTIQQTPHSRPTFPFFLRVCNAIDGLLVESIEYIQKQQLPFVDEPVKETVEGELLNLLFKIFCYNYINMRL